MQFKKNDFIHLATTYNNKNVLFYVLVLQTGAHSPLQSKKQQPTVKTNFRKQACMHTHTHTHTHEHTHTRTHTHTE